MTKKPTSLQRWLRYHREALLVEKFYLRVEDTPDLEPLLTSEPWARLVDATFHSNTVRDWSEQTSRQSEHVRDAIKKARRDGCTLLLHIDDDEMLFVPGGLQALRRELHRATDTGAFNMHALTLEALAPASGDGAHGAETSGEGAASEECHFAACRAFRHARKAYGAYGGNPVSAGKSFGNLAEPGLQFNSPHHYMVEGRGLVQRTTTAHSGYMRGTVILPVSCLRASN